jgi:hypothetical protein
LTSDVLYLLKSEDELTVDEAIENVMAAEKKGSATIKEQDLFEMPVIELECSRSF